MERTPLYNCLAMFVVKCYGSYLTAKQIPDDTLDELLYYRFICFYRCICYDKLRVG